jgi:hypothetical protein
MAKAREKKLWQLQQDMMDQWLDLSKSMWTTPFAWEKGAGSWSTWTKWMEAFLPRTGLESQSTDVRFFMRAYGEWLGSVYRFWKSNWEMLDNNAIGKAWGNDYLSPNLFRDSVEAYLKYLPNDYWKAMLNGYQKMLDQQISVLKEADLPFDEMAGAMERLLARFMPMDDEQAFSLGNNLHKYLEILINPFYAISGTPRVMEWLRHWRLAQFYLGAFWLKSTELRGKVLENSLAVFPETLKIMLEEFEEKGDMNGERDFADLFTAKMEERMEGLLRSDDYMRIQKELSEIGFALKARLDALGELMLGSLPVMTHADEDDIAREIESIRLKIRKLEQAQRQQRSGKAAAFSES